MARAVNKVYNAHPTLQKFHASASYHRLIRGPRGSGKSTGCCIEIFKKGHEQRPDPSGSRRTRFAVIRNTYRELEDTTLKTWLGWFPEEHVGPFNRQKMTHHIKYHHPKYGIIDMEVLFRALDRPNDVKKTLSLELTGAYINEAKEVPFGLISGLDDAVGRYPEKDVANGFLGATWEGVIMDTNSPDDDHWWYKLEEKFRNGKLDASVWEFFVQPGGLIERNGEFIPNPAAENTENLPSNYYTTRAVGKSKDHIRVYYCNEFGFVIDGKPVHPDFHDSVHTAKEILLPEPGIDIVVGIDFGLTPAAAFIQELPNGRYHVIDELVTERMGIDNFAKELKKKIAKEYKGFKFSFGGDPAGSQESQTREETCFQILSANEIEAVPAYHNNDPIIRREALDAPLKRMIDGKPGILFSPKCKTIRKGLAGGYAYKRLQIANEERYHEKPDKNKFSHACEGLEYGFLMLGEGDQLIEKSDNEIDQSLLNPGIIIDRGAHDHAGYSQGWME